MKGIKRLLAVAMMAVMVFTIVVPHMTTEAFAASKKYVQGDLVSDTDLEYAFWSKINGGYYAAIDNYDANWNVKNSTLYYKASSTGKAKKIYTTPEGYQLAQSIVTNGTKVYLTSYKEGKFKLHQASTSGKTKKTLKTKTVEGNSYAEAFNVYGGRIYISAGDDLYAYTIESKKLSRVKKSFMTPYRYQGENTYNGQSRYVYGAGYTDEKGDAIVVYDCKNKKTLRTIKNAYSMHLYGGKVHYLKNSDGIESLYKGSVTGKDAKVIYTFPANAEVLRGTYEDKMYFFFSTPIEGTYDWTYSKLSLDSLEVETITQEEWDTALINSYAGPF